MALVTAMGGLDWQTVTAWLDTAMPWLAAGSVVMLVASAAAAPWLVAQLPSDYFAPTHRPRRQRRHPLIAWPALVLRNILGSVLVLAGAVMLITPGQGLLTLAAGLFLMNFPGKYRLERRLVAMPGVLATLNWLRRRWGVPPLTPPG